MRASLTVAGVQGGYGEGGPGLSGTSYPCRSLPLWRTSYTLVLSFRHPGPSPAPVSSQGQCQGLAEQQCLELEGADPSREPDSVCNAKARGHPTVCLLTHRLSGVDDGLF